MKRPADDNEIAVRQGEVKQRLVEQYIEYRKLRNLTQEDLAFAMGIKRPNISRFETGQCNPTLDLLVKMADCMDLDIQINLVDKKGELGNEEK